MAHTSVVARWIRASLMAAVLGAALGVVGCQSTAAGSGTGSGSKAPESGSGSSPAPTAPAPAATPAPAPAAGSTASLPPTASPDSQSGSASGPDSSAAGRAQTSEERRSAIDKRFDDSLGSFDSQIRKEQEKNAQERDARNAASVGTVPVDSAGAADSSSDSAKKEGDLASGGSAGTEGPNDDAKGKSDKPRRPGDLRSDKDNKTGNSSGSTKSGAGAGATEIPDGSDDDVVARRLRKAAEAETDPELKEKLWKEYIEYKKNAK